MTTSSTLERFSNPAAWSGGGSHALSLLYRHPTPAKLQAARDALWTFPGLEGCWRHHDRPPTAASRLASTWGIEPRKPLFGVAQVPGSGGIPCEGLAWVDDHGIDDDCPLCRELARNAGPPEGWVALFLPFGALGCAYPIGTYPEEDGSSLAWRAEVDGWLCALAAHVHRAVPFDLALLGWTDGSVDPLPASPEEVPPRRSLGYLLPSATGLDWFPPTLGAPIGAL